MLGLGLGLWPRRVGAGGASLELAGSLAFPQLNHRGNDKSYLTATGLSDPIFAAAGALIVTCQIPWRDRQPIASDLQVHILSNADSNTADASGEMALFHTYPSAEATDPAITFIANNGTTTIAATCTLPDRTAERFTIVIERDGADELTMLVYSDGSAVGTVTYAASEQTLSTLTLRNSGFLLGCPSASGRLTPSLLSTNRAFTGSISFVGYYDGAVGASNTAAISAGADPLTTLTAANFRLARKPRALSGDVAAADGATGDALPAWTRTTASGASWRRGSDVVPARNGSGHWLALDAIRDGTVWGVQVGQTSVAVPLSGASSGLTGGVEARALYANGAVQTDWTTVTGATLTGGGAWSGTVTLPLFSGGWGVIEVRAAGDTDVVFKSRALCGVGYVGAIWAQSTANYPISPDLATTGDPVSIASYGNLSYAIMYHPSGGTAFEVGRVTAENPIGGGFFLGASEELRRYTNVPVMLFDGTKSGTGIQELLDDTDTDRLWDDEVLPLVGATSSLVTAHGLDWATAAGYSWYSIGQSSGDERLDALINGTTGGSTAGWTVNHHLLDGDMSANAVVYFMYLFNDANDVSASTDYSLQTSEFYADLPNGAKFREDFFALYAAANAAEGWWAVSPHSYDNYAVSTHVVDRTYGSRYGRRWVQGLMRTVGLDTTTNPEITGVSINGANNVITVTINLPNGGDLQTRWGFEGTSVPEGENPVQGFEVAEFTAANATRSGFTTAITDTGTGTAPNRTGTVTLTKTTGTWGPGAIVYYVPERVLAYGATANAKELIDGLLYESGPAEGGMGLLLKPRVELQARPVVPADDIDHTACAFDMNTATMFQERDTTSGGTPVGIGDPIGTIVPSGTAGGYFTAPSDAERPLLKADANGARYAEITSGRGLNYHNGAGVASPLMPTDNTWHFGAAVESLADDVRRAVFSQYLSGQTGRFEMTQNNGPVGGGWWTLGWNGIANAFRTSGTVPRELTYPSGETLVFQFNFANGSEASNLYGTIFTNDTFTAPAGGTYQGRPFRIGLNDELATFSIPDGEFKLYAFILSDDTLTDDERGLARTYLMSAAGHPYPHK